MGEREMRSAYTIPVRKSEVKPSLRTPRRVGKIILKWILQIQSGEA
jgi:hypothetical protein